MSLFACISAPTVLNDGVKTGLIARRTKHRTASLVALLAAALATPLAYAIPKRTGWVTDEAHALTATERMALSAELESFERRTSHEIAVVLLSKLDGTSIEDESYSIGRTWRIGKENKDDGVVLVLAMAEHQSRIEVGKGVGDRLTDIESAEILDHIVRPKCGTTESPTR